MICNYFIICAEGDSPHCTILEYILLVRTEKSFLKHSTIAFIYHYIDIPKQCLIFPMSKYIRAKATI